MKRSKRIFVIAAVLVVLAAAIFSTMRMTGVGKPAPKQRDTAPAETPEPVQSSEQESSPEPDKDIGLLRISELMAKNRTTHMDSSGEFHDWVEIENVSGAPVSLGGWSLSDKAGKGKWSFPDVTLESGGFCLVYCGSSSEEFSVDFGISEGESVYLFTPAGNMTDSLACTGAEPDVSYIRDAGGKSGMCLWPTPGLPNTGESYDALAAAHTAQGPIVISEVMSANNTVLKYNGEYYDWVEIKNISSEAVDMSGYWLSDDEDDLHKWQFPQLVLGGGKRVVIYCTDDAGDVEWSYNLHSDIALDGLRDELYLSDGEGIRDWVSIHDVPSEGSLCRSEDGRGFVYCLKPTPGEENGAGFRRVSAMPTSCAEDGVFNGADSISVELSAVGEIHYTLDGSCPTAESELYTAPITVDRTCVVRAVAVEDNCAPSRPLTQNYIINENHTLPVLSLSTDSPAAFNTMYYGKIKGLKLPASLSLYEDGESFTIPCGVCMKGWTSLNDDKKNLGVSFGGRFGSEPLHYDVFDNGIDSYTDLSIRAGQDYRFSVIRNELCQDLCLAMSDSVLTQESKYCILYINGEYWGLYCMKEELNRQFYATHAGVSRDSVQNEKAPFNAIGDFGKEVLGFVMANDMTRPENYEYICSIMDVDSFIDWFILEGFCGNTDVQGNLRVYRSSEDDGLWKFAFYDLDWAFTADFFDFIGLYRGMGNCGYELPRLARDMLQNEEFRDRFLTRFAEVNKSVLSNENVMKKLEELTAEIEPEMERNQERWGMSMNRWLENMGVLKKYFTEFDWESHNRKSIRDMLGLSDSEFQKYFGE